MLGVPLDQGLYECGLAGSRRAYDYDDEWGGFLGGAIHHRDMEALFVDLHKGSDIQFHLVEMEFEREKGEKEKGEREKGEKEKRRERDGRTS